jgi:hypothetical protein
MTSLLLGFMFMLMVSSNPMRECQRAMFPPFFPLLGILFRKLDFVLSNQWCSRTHVLWRQPRGP